MQRLFGPLGSQLPGGSAQAALWEAAENGDVRFHFASFDPNVNGCLPRTGAAQADVRSIPQSVCAERMAQTAHVCVTPPPFHAKMLCELCLLDGCGHSFRIKILRPSVYSLGAGQRCGHLQRERRWTLGTAGPWRVLSWLRLPCLSFVVWSGLQLGLKTCNAALPEPSNDVRHGSGALVSVESSSYGGAAVPGNCSAASLCCTAAV